MAGKNKLKKFAEVANFENVFENLNRKDGLLTQLPEIHKSMKGFWAQEYFKNDNPIILELACGGGEYTVAMAKEYP